MHCQDEEVSPTSQYALGSTDAEHQRLIRQAKWLAAHMERLFRDPASV